ncbi:MAG: dolichol-P-glucose synthetase [Cyclobacteriaceae bacterium]|nr:MAG: dolichol-P-glucose synthetase [Cyclobacteriaceae bacterium]
MAETFNNHQFELSIVMPCLNEAETLAICIKKAMGFLTSHDVSGEVVIADNGSTDGSQQIAVDHGARVVDVEEKGYGNALKGGIEAAQGKFVIMGDADDSYDFENLMPYVEKLRAGYDLVMGNRFKGGVQKGAMPFLHKYLGNPVLSLVGKVFFNIQQINDFHCGLRGFQKDAFKQMDLKTTGMEFASEMVVKAALLDMKIMEVPTTLSQDGRTRPPHLNTWTDGWRHLRFLMLYSPKWLYLIPGAILMVLGILLSALIIPSAFQLGSITLDINTLVFANGFIIVGFQAVIFYYLTKAYALKVGLLPNIKKLSRFFDNLNLEIGLILGGLMLLVGLILSFLSINFWAELGFGNINDIGEILRFVIPSITLSILGVQVIFFSFFLSIIGLKTKLLN